MAIERPDPATYARYFQQYVDRVPDGDVLFTLTSQVESTCALVAGFGEEGALHRYAEGKWGVKEVVGPRLPSSPIWMRRRWHGVGSPGTTS
ncbi:hypothetical protein H8E07_18605 [bacterium]|nr:hypothetical protein [bacterium]